MSEPSSTPTFAQIERRFSLSDPYFSVRKARRYAVDIATSSAPTNLTDGYDRNIGANGFCATRAAPRSLSRARVASSSPRMKKSPSIVEETGLPPLSTTTSTPTSLPPGVLYSPLITPQHTKSGEGNTVALPHRIPRTTANPKSRWPESGLFKRSRPKSRYSRSSTPLASLCHGEP